MKKKLLILLASFAPFLSNGQYLPEVMGSSINSAYDEINPVLSPSGDTLYFSRVGHPENRLGKGNTQDIWFSLKDAYGNWTSAERMAEPFNRGRYNALFSISPDGKQALINGVFTRNGKIYKERGLSVITRTENGWEKPQKLKVKGLNKMMDGRYFSADLDWEQGVLVMSFGKGFNSKNTELYISHKKDNNTFSRPKRLKQLNGAGSDFSPFISEDGRKLIFASERWKGTKYEVKESGYDIYEAERQGENWKDWSTPSLIVDRVHSILDELFYKEYGSGVYYSSDTAERGNMDIYYLKKEN